MKCAIMQPTYLPWIGYFDLMDQVDVFVLLDNVQFSRQSWQQRNRIKTRQGLLWLTVPVNRKFPQMIQDVEITEAKFARQHTQTIRMNYAKADYFKEYFEATEATLGGIVSASRRLLDVNVDLIHFFCRQLGIQTKTIFASTLQADGDRSEVLANICDAVGADCYVSPPGSAEYLLNEAGAFSRKKIEVVFHHYAHPTYQQLFPPFLSYTSAIDLLLNEGSQSLEIIRRGRRSPLSFEIMVEMTRTTPMDSSDLR
jgi:hypothetical protein